MAKQRVYLVDGSNLAFRAFFALPSNFSTADGTPTNAVYGFALMFQKLFGGKTPDFGAIVFDAPGRTFRDELYPEYKADRPPLPGDLRVQLALIDELVAVHNFPTLRVPGIEADDVIGTLTRQATEAGMEVFIVSSDKDFAQLIDDDVRMLDTLRNVTYDAELVRKKWGVVPGHIVDYLALIGDKIDNVPGIPGVGQKTAVSLIERFGQLPDILASTAELKGKLKERLEEHGDQASLSRELVTIVTDAPLPMGLEDLAVAAPDSKAVGELYKRLEFYSLLSDEQVAEAAEVDEAVDYVICRDADHVASELERALAAAGDQPLAVQALYDLPSPIAGRFVGLAFSGTAGRAAYVPLFPRARGLGESGLAPLRAVLEDERAPKVTYDAKGLWQLCARHGIRLDGVVADVMLASFLVDATKIIPHQLNQISKEYLQRVMIQRKGVTGSGRNERAFSELPGSEAGPYACHLVDIVGQAWPKVGRVLDARGQTAHLREVDLPLAWVLAQMELDGIAVDQDSLHSMGEEFAERLAGYEARIYALAGREFNVASNKQLGGVLFDELGLPVIKRTKTGYSTNAEVLERLAVKGHEIAHVLLDWRKLSKLISTYTNVLAEAVSPATGRIHATFCQTVGATGRLISTDPDLQRTPVRTAEGQRIRETFVAPPGTQLIVADWSQIELRILAHFSRDERLVDSFWDGLDIHRRTASELFEVAPDEVTPEQRNVGKTVNFATIYGQGATALGQLLKIPRVKAKSYQERYFAIFSGVRRWLDETIASAHETGYVTTLFDRRRYLPELTSRNVMERTAGERIAANTPIQGSAADLCKLAMLNVHKSLRSAGLKTKMLLQIHDELVFEAPVAEVDRAMSLVRHHMQHVYDLEVPLVVDVGVGPTWAAAK